MQQNARLPLWFLITNWCLVAGAFALGAYLARRSPFPDPQATALHLVYDKVLQAYLDPVEAAALLDKAISGVADVDRYSRYIPASDVPAFVEQTTGTYQGIGVVIHTLEERLFVHFPMANGPGEAAGIMPGDEIVAIDGDRLAEMTETERGNALQDRVKGPAGTEVILTVKRTDSDDLEIAITRAAVQKPAVRWAQILDAEQGLGYVHVADFHNEVTRQLDDAIDQLADTASGLQGLIVDLRFDGGGSLTECVEMSNRFLPEGTIVTVERRDSQEVFLAEPDKCTYPDLPLVLLVNGSTASASEVLTGALQDHERASVVGSRTFGKGHVQTVYSWADLDFRLKLTTAQYLTPNGRSFGSSRRLTTGRPAEPDGLTPDYTVKVEPELARRIAVLLRAFEIPSQYREAVAIYAQTHDLTMPGIVPPDEDPQLAKALEVLDELVEQAGGK